MSNNNTVSEQHAIIGNTSKSTTEIKRTTHPGAEWFFKPVNLGLFIHFGISAVHGDLDISWGMMDNPVRRAKGNSIVTPREYWALAEKFDPKDYDPLKWLTAAKDAGFTYAVFTTRHHDGFALWPSDAGDFSTKNYMNGRDLVREYADACRAAGLKVGFYYSPPDWRFDQNYRSFAQGSRTKENPERPHADIDHKPIEGELPEMPAEHFDRYIEYMNAQVRELLTNYGKIDILWYDVACPLHNFESWDSVNRNARLRKLQPHIIINDRTSLPEDFDTPEQSIRASTRDWEACNTLTRLAWGYVDEEQSKPFAISSKQILRDLHLCTCGGGNLLLNISPAPDGSVTKDTEERLIPVGEWLKINGDAAYGKKFRTGPVYSANTLTAVSADKDCKTFYLWNWVWPKNGRLIFGGYMDAPKKISYLATGEEIKFRADGHRIILEGLPSEVPDKITGVTVLKMEFENAPRHIFRSYYPQIHQGTDFSEGYHKW